jgi:hypothetical protein
MIPDTKEGRWSEMAAVIAGLGVGLTTLLSWLNVSWSALIDISRAIGVVGVIALVLFAYAYISKR